MSECLAPAQDRGLWSPFWGLIAEAPHPRRTLARVQRWSSTWAALETLAWQAPPAAQDAARTLGAHAAARLAVDRVAVAAVALLWGADPWRLVAELGTTRDRRPARIAQRFTREARARLGVRPAARDGAGI